MRLWSARRSSGSPSTDGPSGVDGGVRFDPVRARRGHVESWFLKANDPHGRRAVWLKWTLWSGDRAPACAVAETWAVAFGTARGHIATKTSVPFEQARFVANGSDALGVTIDDCALSPQGARGRVASGGRAIAYDLSIASLEAPYTLYGARWMVDGPIPPQKAVSPIPNARISGVVEVDGEAHQEKWELDAWPGMVGHNWGRHTERYVWGHCNAWDDGDDVVFEGASGRMRVGGVLLPFRTGMIVRHHGTTYRLSGLASLLRNRASVTPRRWQFRGAGRGIQLEGEMWAETDDFVGLFYPNPDDTMVHCLNSKIAHAEVTLRMAGRPPKTLRSSRAALELGTTDPHHGVRMYV